MQKPDTQASRYGLHLPAPITGQSGRACRRLLLGLSVCLALCACPSEDKQTTSAPAESAGAQQAAVPEEKAVAASGQDSSSQDQINLLFKASLAGDVETLRRQLDKGVDPKVTDPYGMGYTVLMCAALGGNVESVKLLLDKGADLSKSKEGRTALMYAAAGGNLEIVKLLVAKGSDLKATTTDEETVLMMAFLKDKLSFRDLYTDPNPSPPNPAVVQWLLDQGANPQARSLGNSGVLSDPVYDPKPLGVLSYAAHGGNLDAFNLVVAKGANFKDNYVDLLLALCVNSRLGTPELAQRLVDQGATLQMKLPDGHSLLWLANNANIVKFLLSKGLTAEKDKTLVRAASDGDDYLDVTQALLDGGANPNATFSEDVRGSRNALDAAIFIKGLPGMATTDLLLAHGAKPTSQHLFYSSGQLELVKKLIAHGADPKAKNEEGKTLLDLARESNHTEMIQYLSALP